MQKILLICDNQDVRKRLSEGLQVNGWIIIEVLARKDAVALAKQNHPDVVLLDMSSPQDANEETPRALKLDPLTCTIPIVALTMSGQPQAALEHWVSEVVSPATALPIILAKLQRAVGRRGRLRPLVLIVDDEPDLVEILTALLQENGFLASGALNGADAFDVVRSVRPDAILLDLEMPKLDGWELLSRLKRITSLENIAIVILTGKAQSKEERERGIALGAFKYLLKPCPPDEIVRTLKQSLTRSHLDNS